MPAPGDQHTGVVNPFVEPQRHISVYTAQEIATLQSRLEKQLGPEYLSSRAGPSNQRVHYITAEKCIALANEVFGFNGWSSSIQNIQVDFCDEDPQTRRVSLGLSVVVRVTLRDGTYHEDFGYGSIDNCRGKAAAFEKAKKEGTTDALKRALRHFGNVLGNCIYDKTYLANVTKIKVAPTKFDENRLHRHSDFLIKKAPAEVEAPGEQKTLPPAPAPAPPAQLPTTESFEAFLGDLDEADFNISDEGHPDEVVLPNSNETDSNQSNVSNKSHDQPSHASNGGNNSMRPPVRQLVRATSAGNNPPRQPPQTPIQHPPRPNVNNFPGIGAQNLGPSGGPRPLPQQFNQNRPAPQPNNTTNQHQNHNHNPHTHMTPPHQGGGAHNAGPPGGEALGFFSARVVKAFPEESLADRNNKLAPKPGQTFNPRLESPSIPRTPGIDHTASKPLSRTGMHVAPFAAPKTGDGDDEPSGGGAGAGAGAGVGIGGGGGAGGAGVGVSVGAARPGAGPRPPGNMVHPQLDQARRIGAPGSLSPLGNRGQFRPLTVKRPAGGGGGGGGDGAAGGANGGPAAAAGRVPLGDMPSNAVVGRGAGGESGPDLKRQRTS
ncbi:hypothetical protein C8A00DRAFT_44187 [Chaetomidium leptoderma]|uniref:RAD52 homolog n=1 Tax=Chaetomidium leptoderma TaxID=669021 RepID=A0AAN6VK62_9PEZI|nr:hypothetical protein C8A00DRAFT_44187 [Chaetomidium leptoderma]